MSAVKLIKDRVPKSLLQSAKPTIWQGRSEHFLDKLPEQPLFDLVITSPPYNLGKAYEKKRASLDRYLANQQEIIKRIVARLRPGGSLCWQVGNFVENGEILPLDIELHPIFKELKLNLRNRIVWRFGHGLHGKRRFSGRYEVIMWYTHGDDYTFDLDAVRVPQNYPAKRHHKGPNIGRYSSHPLGKNPEDVWDMDLDVWKIPNVKGNHIEKTVHPCQFPVGLAERLVLALSKKGDLVFDPYAGVASTGIAAVAHGRKFWGCERYAAYCRIAKRRLEDTICGDITYRPYNKPLYDPAQSKLSIPPVRELNSKSAAA